MTQQTIELHTPVPFPAHAVWEWHTRPGAFERLSPPWQPVRVLESGAGIVAGEGKTLRVGSGLLSTRWQVRHTLVEPGRGFVDEQVTGPFAAWRHEHWFEPDGPGACRLVDRITYQLPAGRLTDPLAGRRVRHELERLLRFRHARLAHDLARHAAVEAPLRVAISGASGLVGRQLTHFLTSGGHQVVRLVRGVPQGPDEVRWDPAAGTIDAAALEGLDAVVHLAGENISGGRWSAARRRAIRQSRVEGTGLLARTLAGLERPPRVFVSASAVGVYGDRGETLLAEDATLGEGFLSEVCREWEAAAEPARRAGIRVVHPRLGVVISAQGGMLARILPLFRLGLGGRLGSGRQWFSWIALDDLLGLLLQAIADERLAGPLNAVAPQPVTNREMTKTLAATLGRPAILPAPAAGLRLAFGRMADEVLLAGQRVVPAAAHGAGYTFAYPSLGDALNLELGRLPAGAPTPVVQARSTVISDVV